MASHTLLGMMMLPAAFVPAAGPFKLGNIAGGTIVAAGSARAAERAWFIASPMSGSAPLTVKFCASAGIAIGFGDGTSSGLGAAPLGACPRSAPMYAVHVYAAPGRYRLAGSPCPGRGGCGEVAQQANGVTIAVTPHR